MNGDKRIHAIVGSIVFVISFAVYLRTLAPTTSFWDCGEFITCAYIMGVPHPPGAPLYVLIGRIFSMLPTASDIGFRVNLASPMVSAFTALFTYLIILRLIKEWKGAPKTTEDRFLVYGSGLIGALAFAFTDSQWFNSVEAEVYAGSMFFTAIVVWLILVWLEKADRPENAKYLLLIFYLIGLATGVHLLNILALPTVFLIIYFKRAKFNLTTFSLFALLAVGAFMVIYPGIVKGIPWLADTVSVWALAVAILVILYGIYYAIQRRRSPLALSLMSVLLVVLGYSTYSAIFIRSQLDPAVDENDPETLDAMVSYLNREQYGDWKLWPRRAELWDYQIKKMYIRYFGWQFIGKGNTIGSDGFIAETLSLRGLYGLPFMLGLIGMAYHFRKDWRKALSILVLFIFTGIAIIIYLNQENPQPRERDYSYVGSFFAFALWVGIGVVGLVDWVNESLRNRTLFRKLMYILGPALVFLVLARLNRPKFGESSALYDALNGFGLFIALFGALIALVGILEWLFESLKERGSLRENPHFATLLLLFGIAPFNLFINNFHEHDRTGNYVAYDYSYNILQSCEPNAIIFTNGDNDTFPLWFLQYVYNIRRDVRVVNLSLLNTNWYIKQLKNEEPKVPISFSDEEIDQLAPRQWDAQVVKFPVSPAAVEKFKREIADYKPLVPINTDTAEMSVNVKPTLTYRGIGGLRVQDWMILNILYANQWRKPLYFAVTVSEDNKVNLQDYLRMDGLAFKVIPFKDVEISPTRLQKNLFEVYKYRGLNDPTVYYDDNVEGLLQNYRSAFLRLASYYQRVNNQQAMLTALDRMEAVIPEKVIPIKDPRIIAWIGHMYYLGGRADEMEKRLDGIMRRGDVAWQNKLQYATWYTQYLGKPDKAEKVMKEMKEKYPDQMQPYAYLVNLYEEQRQYPKGIEVLQEWLRQKPDDQNARARLAQLKGYLATKDTLHGTLGTPGAASDSAPRTSQRPAASPR